MAGQKERAEAARDALESSRRAALRMGEQVGGAGTKKLLERAARDLKERLEALDRRGLDQSFTAAQLRGALFQVQAVLAPLARGMKGQVLDSAARSAEQAASHAVEYLAQAERAFRGVSQPLALDEARMLDAAVQGSKASALRRMALGPDGTRGKRGVLERYGLETVGHFEKTLQVGLIAKKSWREMRDDLTEQSPFLQGAPAHWAQRIVRSEVMGAYSRGAVESIKDADKQLGGDMVKILSAVFDERTACLLPDVRVTGAVVRAVFRRPYEGLVARLVTRGGRDLSATTKHPMLTRRGWVLAGELRLGDELVCDRGYQGSGASGDEDINGRPPTLGEVFDSPAVLGERERRRGTEQDFHGDGMDRDVDVFRPNGELRLGDFAPLDEPFAQEHFAPSHNLVFCHRCAALFGFSTCEERDRLRAGAEALVVLAKASSHRGLTAPERASDVFDRLSSFVSPHDFFLRQVSTTRVPSQFEKVLHRLGPRPSRAEALQCLEDVTAMGIHRCRNLVAGHTGRVEFDEVLEIQVRRFRGHVFNLTTDAGYFTANGVYTSNSDSYAVHGQIRRPWEPFETWYGPIDAPPARPNDREVVTPHRISWPLPPYLAWRTDDQVLARWLYEGRKGAPPPRPLMTTVPLALFGRG